MAAHVLVVATVTAASDDLLAALTRACPQGRGADDFLLVMPATGSDAGRDASRSSRRRSRAGTTRA